MMKNSGRYVPVKSVDMFGRTTVAFDIQMDVSSHVETVCLLSNRKSKPDTHVDLTLDMEDYYRIKDQEKTVK